MNSSDATRQPVSSCHALKLLQAQDLIAEIVESQRYLSIADTLRAESLIEVDGDLAILLDAYLDSGILEKLQVADELIQSARKAIA